MKIIWVKDQKEEWLRQEGRQSVCPEQVPEEKGGQAVFTQSRSLRRRRALVGCA